MPHTVQATPQQDNLLALQNSTKMIRNPFGFTLKTSWNSEPVEMPGDGNWYPFVGPLANHIVKHLKSAVFNRKHDLEVERLREAGQEKAARKFHLNEIFKNKVHMAITGHADPSLSTVATQEEFNVDFSELEKDMKTLEIEAAGANTSISVAPIQAAAAEQAMNDLGTMADGQVGSVSGSMPMGIPVDQNAGALPTHPVSPQPQNVVQPNGEFPQLKELI